MWQDERWHTENRSSVAVAGLSPSLFSMRLINSKNARIFRFSHFSDYAVQLVGLTCLVYSRTPTRVRLVALTRHGDLSHYTLKLGCRLTRGASRQTAALKRLRQIVTVPAEMH